MRGCRWKKKWRVEVEEREGRVHMKKEEGD